MTSCTIGSKISLPPYEDENAMCSIKDSSPFLGQIGPVYMFSDAITSEQVQGIYSLGPSYMYAFLDNEIAISSDNPMPGGIFDAKDGLASKIVFGLNAQVFFLIIEVIVVVKLLLSCLAIKKLSNLGFLFSGKQWQDFVQCLPTG